MIRRTLAGRSIRAQLAIIAASVACVALVCASLTLIAYEAFWFHAQLERTVQVFTDILAETTTAAVAFSDQHATEVSLQALSHAPAMVEATVFDRSGARLAHYEAAQPQRFWRRFVPNLKVNRPLRVEGETVGSIEVVADLGTFVARLADFALIVLLAASAAMLIACLLAFRLQRVISEPILALVRVASEVERENAYSSRVAASAGGELGLLVQAFNRMLGAVEARDRELELQHGTLERQVSERTEDLVVARERAEEGARLKSEFLANMSHEIRTPMNGIIGMTALALDSEITDEVRQYLGAVRESADALLSVLNDILDFSKIEAGHLSIEPHEFSPSTLMSQAARILAVKADQKELELIVDVSPEVPERVVGDSVRIRQVLLNLLGNAIKFTGRGEVELKAGIRNLEGAEYEIEFSVRDTGPGIRADRLHAIFDPFVQADGSTTRNFGGTGLGLAISSQLVRLMHGSLDVNTEVGKRSTFTFRVPVRVLTSVDIAEPVFPISIDGARILIVDDNETNRHVLEQLLERWGASATSADSAATAIQCFEQACARDEAFDACVIDCRMPGADGFSLAEKLNGFANLSPRMMMLNPCDLQISRERCAKAGIQAWILKPIEARELRQTLSMLLADVTLGSTPAPRISMRPATRAMPFRILVAEDNPINQSLVVSMLNRGGYSQVAVAKTGREAVDMHISQAFDLILMDIQMAEMSGLQATQAIRAWESGRRQRVPIIALTAHAMSSDRDLCLKVGMDDYLPKPIDRNQLFTTLEQLLMHAKQEAAV